MNNYTYVSIIALYCYIFLFISLSASKKTKLIKAFMTLLMAMMFWTGGSFFMRSMFGPSVKFWYDISLLGLCLVPYAFISFVHEFLFNSPHKKDTIWFFLFVGLFIINATTELLLPAPEYTIRASGIPAFYYTSNVYTYIFYCFFLASIIYCVSLIIKGFKENRNQVIRLMPMFAGIACLIFGNTCVMLGWFAGFPIDIVAGVINAICMFYTLYKRRLFRLNLLVSRRSSYVIAGMLSIILFANLVGTFQNILFEHFGLITKNYYVLVIAVAFTIVTAIIYTMLKKFIDAIFIKEEIQQSDSLKEFSNYVSKTLQVNEIVGAMGEIILKCVETKQVYICLLDDNGDYSIEYSSSPLRKNNYIINHENPVVIKLMNNDDMIFYSEFRHSINYRSMWDSEKQLFENLNIEGIIPVKQEQLIGMILLAPKPRRSGYSYGEISFLSSVASISAIALINSKMYETVYNEARSDELTGLLNRKYFYEALNNEYEKLGERQLSLILVSVDDVRLYNQLYGNKEGDIVLINVARIMDDYVNTQGYTARLGGKEFGIILPNYGPLEAKDLAENIREQIMNMNKRDSDYTLKVVTASFGISSIPVSANTIKQLLDYADQALYQSKRHGKNRVSVYNAGVVESTSGVTIVDAHREKQNIYLEYAPTIYALTAAIDAKDHYTFTHSENVAYYATKLAIGCGYDSELVEIINEAALLHDIGKIGISENILKKSSKLSDEEYQIMQSHVEASVNIIRHLPSLDYVIPIVLTHHERYDGRGYPRRISGEDIPAGGRIMAIADSFDAMTSRRSYKEPYSLEYALNELKRNRGLQFDPDLVDKFIELINSGIIEVRGNQNNE